MKSYSFQTKEGLNSRSDYSTTPNAAISTLHDQKKKKRAFIWWEDDVEKEKMR